MKYLDIFENELGVRAFFTTKEGAVKGTPGGTIFNNEEIFEEAGFADAYKVWPKQVHGTNIAVIKEEDMPALRESYPDGLILPETDGIVTNAANVLLTSVHADCLPVYMYDENKGVIGLVHGGWRGVVGGIVPQAIRRMAYVFGAGLDDIKVHVGPGISKCCFEVGEEVPSQFLMEWGASFAEVIERKGSEQERKGPEQEREGTGQDDEQTSEETGEEPETKYLLDLKAAVKSQVLGMKIPEENISISEHCTCCEPELFCSYRRDGETYMRMGAGICMRR